MTESLHNVPIVLDNGSGTIRAGFAGDDLPKCFFPSWVGRPKHLRVLAGALEGDVFIGQKAATELRGLLKIHYPLEHGIVTDWDDMERIWEYVYGEGLKTLSEEVRRGCRPPDRSPPPLTPSPRLTWPAQHPVLLTEPPLNPRSNRDTAAQILFETFNVPALHTSIQAVLSLYASGRTTGIVLDSGDGVSHAVPVYEGFAMPSSIRRIDVAGRDVTEYLQTLLRKSGYVFHTSAEKEVVRLIKESVAYVAHDPRKEERDWIGVKPTESKFAEYTLPDGHRLKVRCPGRVAATALTASRLARSASGPPRSSSTRRLWGSSTPGCTRWWWRPSTAPTWTCASRCTATLCSRAAAPSPRASATGCWRSCRSWRSRT